MAKRYSDYPKYILSPGEEDNVEVWCDSCGDMIPGESDCLVYYENEDQREFYCQKCRNLELGD